MTEGDRSAYVAGALLSIAACSLDDRAVSVGSPALEGSSPDPSSGLGGGGTMSAPLPVPGAPLGGGGSQGSTPASPPGAMTPSTNETVPTVPMGAGGSAVQVSGLPLPLATVLARLTPGETGFVLYGTEGPFVAEGGGSGGGLVGAAVDGGGDVNGDGVPDLLIGAPFYGDLNDAKIPGAAVVVFSGREQAHVDLNQVPSNVPGLLIRGDAAIGQVGTYLAHAGDVNGDGFDDVLVGGVRLDTGAAAYQWPGVAMVVFGSSASRIVDLAQLRAGTGEGFLIEGDGLSGVLTSGSADPRPLAAAGDVNGDGLGDLLVGAPYRGSGRAYVLFGKTSFSRVSLEDVDQGIGGYGYAPTEFGVSALGSSVAALEDVNGDGVVDFAFGAPNRIDDDSQFPPGGARLVWGRASAGTNVPIGPMTGLRIDGVQSDDAVGRTVVAAGDVNGDGLGDLLMNAALAGRFGAEAGGGAYVVFGTRESTNIDLAAIEAGSGGGFLITRTLGSSLPTTPGKLGDSLSPIGDVDGDGRADALVSDPANNLVYVLFGKADGAPVQAGTSTQMRLLMQVPAADFPDGFGSSTAFIGDVNGDGSGDYLIGAPSTRVEGRYQSGAAYVIYGPGVAR